MITPGHLCSRCLPSLHQCTPWKSSARRPRPQHPRRPLRHLRLKVKSTAAHLELKSIRPNTLDNPHRAAPAASVSAPGVRTPATSLPSSIRATATEYGGNTSEGDLHSPRYASFRPRRRTSAHRRSGVGDVGRTEPRVGLGGSKGPQKVNLGEMRGSGDSERGEAKMRQRRARVAEEGRDMGAAAAVGCWAWSSFRNVPVKEFSQSRWWS